MKPLNPPIGINTHYTKAPRLGFRHFRTRNSERCPTIDVRRQHLAVIHFVDVVSAKDQHELRLFHLQRVNVLKDGISGSVGSSVGSLASLSISPNPQTLAINGVQQFVASGKDNSGASVAVTPVWSVVTGGGTITASGMFTAGTLPGTYTNTVMATSGGLTATATVIVTIGPLASITVTPNPATLAIGATQQFVAVGKDVAGNVVQITPTWSATTGGTISGAGLFTAGGTPGTFTNSVQAVSGGITGSATVIVTVGHGPQARVA